MEGGFVKSSAGIVNDFLDIEAAVAETKKNYEDITIEIGRHKTAGAKTLHQTILEIYYNRKNIKSLNK